MLQSCGIPALALSMFLATTDGHAAYNSGSATNMGYIANASSAQRAQQPKRKKMPDPLKGSKQSMRRQNAMADRYNLSRIEDDAMLRRFINAGLLVPLKPDGRTYFYDSDSPREYAYARPYTRQFIERLSGQYCEKFHKKLKVTSAVRPRTYQNRLRHNNANASRASSHMTGATVDISKVGMKRAEKRWMQNVLRSLEYRGCVEATEENRQATFHIMVYPTYPCARSSTRKK